MANLKVVRPDGPIAKPGIYQLSLEAYHGQPCDGPSISSSGLRTIANESPADFWAYSSLNPDRVKKKPTEAQILGSAAHHLLLGEEGFQTQYIARPAKLFGIAWQGNRTDCKEWLREQAAAGRTVLTEEQIWKIRSIAKSLGAHPLIRAGILNGLVEKSIFWRPKDFPHLWGKARPDAMPTGDNDFADLKLTASVQTDHLARTIAEYGYHQQAAWIGEGWHSLTGRKMETFSLVFVQNVVPFSCRIITLRDEDLMRGERQNHIAMMKFAHCLETREWPGPGGADAEAIHLPSWERDKIDRQLGDKT